MPACEWLNGSVQICQMIWERKCWAWRIHFRLTPKPFVAYWRQMAWCVRVDQTQTRKHFSSKWAVLTILAMLIVITVGETGRIAWTSMLRLSSEQERSCAFRILTCESLAKCGSTFEGKLAIPMQMWGLLPQRFLRERQEKATPGRTFSVAVLQQNFRTDLADCQKTPEALQWWTHQCATRMNSSKVLGFGHHGSCCRSRSNGSFFGWQHKLQDQRSSTIST